MSTGSFIFRVHAVQRMFQRHISVDAIVKAMETGDIVEDYSADMAEPGWLILGNQGKHPFHLVASRSFEEAAVTIVTVYIPDSDRWEKDNRNRRQ